MSSVSAAACVPFALRRQGGRRKTGVEVGCEYHDGQETTVNVDELLAGMRQDCGLESLESALKKAQALAAIGGDEVAERLLADTLALDEVDLEDDSGDMADELFRLSQALSTALGDMRPAPVDALLEVASDETRLRARCCAIRALGRTKDARAVVPLIRILEAREIEEIAPTMDAIQALGELRDARAVPSLLGMLDPPDEQNRGWLRRLAAGSLGRIGDARALEPLATILRHDEDWFARLGAVEGLRAMRQVSLMREALGDEHPQVRMAAQKALGMSVEEAPPPAEAPAEPEA